MDATASIDGEEQVLSGLTVYRPRGSPVGISSPDLLTFDVSDGSLIVWSGSGETRRAVYIFSPGQWVTVNIAPV